MGENMELEALRRRVAELEKQLADDRETFEWDIKATKETADATIRKLEQQLAEYKKPSSQVGHPDVELLQKRAMLAERKVAELQAEAQKLQATRLEKSDAAGDSFMRQRAEQAEREREELRKEKRSLERRVEELENKLRKQQEELDKGASVRAELEKLRGEVAAKEREVKKLESALAQAAAGQQEKSGPVADTGRQREKDAEIEKLRRQLEQSQTEKKNALEQKQQLEAKAGQLEAELGRLKISSGQILEQRERESGRLQADLKQAQEQQVKVGQQMAELQQQLAALRRELEQKRSDYSRLLEQHEKLRESQDTQVGRAPDPPAQKADPFEEKTVKTSVPLGAGTETVRDGRPLGSQLPPPPVAEPAPAERERTEQAVAGEESVADEVITGELVAGNEPQLEPLETEGERNVADTVKDDQKPRFAPSRTDIVREKSTGKALPLRVWHAASLKKRIVLAGGALLALAALAAGVWWLSARTVQEGEIAAPATSGEKQAAPSEPPSAIPAQEPTAAVERQEGPAESAADQQELQKKLAQIKELMLKKKYDEMHQLTRYLVEKFPDNALARYYYGRALFYRKEPQAAAEELKLSLQLEPSLREAWYELVGVYIVLKQKNPACEAARKYIEASPAQDQRAAALKKNLARWGCR